VITFLAWMLFVGLVVVGVFLIIEKLQRNKQEKQFLSENSQLRHYGQQLAEQVEALSKYQGILDVQGELDALRQQIHKEKADAEHSVEELLQEGRKLAAAHEEDLKAAKAELRKKQKEAEESQAALLSRASAESSRIIEEANRKAEVIAGDAYQSLRDTEHLKATAKAMSNAIKGYGDEYLVPNHAALDDLADEYTHKQAGIDLKTARARTRQMVATGTAATCDYAEKGRKETAIRFVLDAFNGKVDSALSTVRHNNYGKLRQEVVDAFALVNEHGKAFRNARILPEYLEARQNELRWAVAVMELQLKEREEQRRIKQEMREEERARREYEKAIKQAEKEEKLLEKLMAEAQEKLQASSEEERSEYERKIQELQQKYREAEERNKRALSMAQQTKRGHVYVISNVGSFGEDVFKIGLTRRLEPLDRVKELGDASVPFDYDVHAMIYNEDAPKLETTLHQVFADFQVNKVNPRKEFFRVGIKDIRELLETIGIDAKWTMLAEAKEYRETMAIEREGGQEKRIREPDPEVAQVLASSETAPPADHGLVQTTVDSEVLPPAENAKSTGTENDDSSTSPVSEPPEESINVQVVACPHCGGDLLISTLVAGVNVCPHCNGNFEVDM
jgi:hypothetical protein